MSRESERRRRASFEEAYSGFHGRGEYRRRWSTPFDLRNAEDLWHRVDEILSQADGPIRRVLEVGCGSGSALRQMASRVGPSLAVGVDLRRNRLSSDRRGIDFCVADASALPFRDGVFDLAFQFVTFSSIQSRSGKREAAREIRRVLRVGGLFLWYDFRFPNPWNPFTSRQSASDLSSHFPGVRLHTCTMTLAPFLGRLLYPRYPRVFGLLERMSILRTHLLAWLRKSS